MSVRVLGSFSTTRYHRDRLASFVASLVFHVCLFFIGGILLVKPLEYGVERGASGVEINLVAAPEPIVQDVAPEEPLPDIVHKDPDPILVPVKEIKPETTVREVLSKMEISQKDQTTFQSAGGAIVEAKPDYLSNPAPRYPLKARQSGWQGTVLLKASVDRQGKPIRIEIERGSGYDILDQAALKAVKVWNFQPAKLGTLAVESTVKIPIRFDLKDAK